MRVKLLMVASLALICGLELAGCKKAEQKPQIDPHSPEGIMLQVVDLAAVLREGVRVKDFAYVADRAFYLQGSVKALQSKLNPEDKQRLDHVCNDVIRVAEELDHSAGRRHEGATVASMEKLDLLLKELEGGLGGHAKK